MSLRIVAAARLIVQENVSFIIVTMFNTYQQ